jgi:hypothetical protein
MQTKVTQPQANQKAYTKPRITRVKLDNEISMVMESMQPGDPNGSITPGERNDPYKIDLA